MTALQLLLELQKELDAAQLRLYVNADAEAFLVRADDLLARLILEEELQEVRGELKRLQEAGAE